MNLGPRSQRAGNNRSVRGGREGEKGKLEGFFRFADLLKDSLRGGLLKQGLGQAVYLKQSRYACQKCQMLPHALRGSQKKQNDLAPSSIGARFIPIRTQPERRLDPGDA